MECKHGTHEPCDLCAEEDAEHDREMAIQARIDAARADERERIRARLMEMHERDKERHNYWHVAVVELFGS
jgi:hypothetical protein